MVSTEIRAWGIAGSNFVVLQLRGLQPMAAKLRLDEERLLSWSAFHNITPVCLPSVKIIPLCIPLPLINPKAKIVSLQQNHLT